MPIRFRQALVCAATTEQAGRKKVAECMTTISTPPVTRLRFTRYCCLLACCCPVSLLDSLLACSILVGGLIQIGPQAWFARQAYKYTGSRQVAKSCEPCIWVRLARYSNRRIVCSDLYFIGQLDFLTVFSAFIVMFPSQWYLP